MSLRDFLKKIEKNNQVLHIPQEVSPIFEISNIIARMELKGSVLEFEKVKGYSNPVVANVCGSRERLCSALNVGPEGLYGRLLDAWRSPRRARLVKDGSAREYVQTRVSLLKIPILTHFELDPGRYITSGIVHAKSVDDEIENVSVHRLQVLDNSHLAIRLVPRHLFKLWKQAKALGKDLDIAIAIGVHPALLLAASSPVPLGVSEYDVANSLLQDHLSLIDCNKVNASAPADSELILEGRISASKEVVEGPFVDITGTHDIQRTQPVVDVISVMHRENYLYEALLPSGTEHRLLMGLPHEISIWENVSKVVPRVCAVNLSNGGCGWLHAVISIEKQVDGDAKNAVMAAFSAHPSLKHAVIVDSDIDVFDPAQVEWAIATRFQASEDMLLIQNVRGSTLDASANQETGLTSKVGIDATIPSAKPKAKFERARIPSGSHVDKLVNSLTKEM